MGLDSFWVKPGDNTPTPIVLDPPVNVIGGLFSGNGNDSFRGKCYDDVVLEASGITLYTERLPNRSVRLIANALDRRAAEDAAFAKSYRDFLRMFRAHADAGHDLLGWW
jgi:hypothetical protein